MNIENLPSLNPKYFGSVEDPALPILSIDSIAKGPHCFKGHDHPRAQILYPVRGVYRVRTPLGQWVVPPGQAIWIPSHVFHEVYSTDSVESLLLFIDEVYTVGLPQDCIVINVSSFLREMFVKAVMSGNDYTSNSLIDKNRRFLIHYSDINPDKVSQYPLIYCGYWLILSF